MTIKQWSVVANQHKQYSERALTLIRKGLQINHTSTEKKEFTRQIPLRERSGIVQSTKAGMNMSAAHQFIANGSRSIVQ